MSDKRPKEFGKIQAFFWPIYKDEYKKLLPMALLFFLTSFVYNLTRTIKISLMVSAEGSGAFAIPFLKVGAVLPGALLFTYIFTRLSSRYSAEKVFYQIVSFFLLFFLFFIMILLPNKEAFELKGLAQYLSNLPFWPEGFDGLLAIIRHWSISVFYVLCEMWSNIVLSMLFWGFANEVTKVEEAKRFYAIFALGANISGIFSGQFAANWQVGKPLSFLSLETAFEQTVFLQILAVIIIGLFIMLLFYGLNRTVYANAYEEHVVLENKNLPKSAKKKRNLTMTQCFSYLRKSPYVLKIVLVVVCYNIVYNLADVLWTNRVKSAYEGDPAGLHNYINQVTSLTGIVAVFSALIISGNIIRRFGWTIAALTTPIVWLITSFGFFAVFLADESSSLGFGFFTFIGDMLAAFVGNPTNAVLIFGSAQICLGRACKYTVFDETKEILFIPLPKEDQRKAKAVVDGLATRFGKSGGSVIILVLLGLFGNILNALPYITVIFFAAIGVWIFAVLSLGKMVVKTIDIVEAPGEESSTDDTTEACAN